MGNRDHHDVQDSYFPGSSSGAKCERGQSKGNSVGIHVNSEPPACCRLKGTSNLKQAEHCIGLSPVPDQI